MGVKIFTHRTSQTAGALATTLQYLVTDILFTEF